MGDLLVRNLPSETLDALKRRAKRHRRSVQAEVFEIIQKEISAEQAGDFWAVAAMAREESRGRWHGDSADIIRQDRESH